MTHHFTTGEKVAPTVGFVGCMDIEKTRRVSSIADNKYVEAFKKFVYSAVGIGCHWFRVADIATVENNDDDRLYVCLRPQGEVDCFWLAKFAVKALPAN